MAAAIGNNYSGKHAVLETSLRSIVREDDGKRIRRGLQIVVNRFAKEGGLADGTFIRDTLDGKPKTRIDLSSEDGSGLQSLQVMFVQAIQERVEARQEALEHVIEGEPCKPD